MSTPADQPAPADRDPALAARVEQLYETHAALVRNVCRSLLRDRIEVEDAVQQTFLSAQRALANGSAPRDAAAWLATIARHESLARVRARMREPLPLEVEERDAAPDTHAAAVRRHEAGELRDALAKLPDQQREAILLREVRGFSYQEVAASLSVTTSAVESLLFRARRNLQARLQEALAALSPGAWVQPLRELAARLAGGGLVAPAAAKVAAIGLGTGVVAGGALVGPTILGHGHAPAVRTKTPRHRVVVSKPPTVFRPTPTSHPAQLLAVARPRREEPSAGDSGSQAEVSDVQSSSDTRERSRSTDDAAGSGASTRQAGSDPTDDSRTSTTGSSSDDSWAGTTTTDPHTPGD